jgi:hypothetical protein
MSHQINPEDVVQKEEWICAYCGQTQEPNSKKIEYCGHIVCEKCFHSDGFDSDGISSF